MKGLDLSKFQKATHKEGFTTLKHADGHEIKIYHKALSPKMQKELEALPMYEGGDAEKKKAETSVRTSLGDAPQEQPAQPLSPPPGAVDRRYLHGENLDQPQVAQPNAQGGRIAANYASKGLVEDEDTVPEALNGPEFDPKEPYAPPASPVGAAMGTEQGTQQADQPQPEPATPAEPQAQAPSLSDSKAGIYNYMNQEEANLVHDLAVGHIKPESYQDLYANKDTQGKIGTLFGLLAGGVGGGLTHQPNVVLGMMDKEIQRDLDAQSKSSENAHNFLRIAQNDPVLKATARKYGADADILAQQKAYLEQANVTYHDLIRKLQTLDPNSPQYKAASQAALIVGQAFGTKLNNAKDLAAATAGVIAPEAGSSTTSAASTPAPGILKATGARDYGIKPILDPKAAEHINSMKLNPIDKEDYKGVQESISKIAPADAVLANLGPTYEKLSRYANALGTTSNIAGEVPQHTSVGALLKLAPNTINALSPEVRRYARAKLALYSDLNNALKGMNISSDQVQNMVDTASPVVGDNGEDVQQARDTMEGFIRRGVAPEISKLQQYNSRYNLLSK